MRTVTANPLGINLLRVSSTGTAAGTPLGTFRDDGTAGDATAGDRIYSLAIPITPTAPERLYYRASAAFQGSLLRSLSSIVSQDAGPSVPSPGITSLIVPAPNADGWNNANLIVYFVCSGGIGTQTCSAPTAVTTETTGQLIRGVVRDNAGNEASREVTARLDKTAPQVTITFPPNVSSQPSPLTVRGSVVDPISGLASATCAGLPGAIDGLNFSCTIPLPLGTSTIEVEAKDRAGNAGKASVRVTRVDGTAPPTITDFTPRSAPAGTLISVTGTNLGPNPTVELARSGGGTINAPVGDASAGSLTFTIPPGAATGRFTIRVGTRGAESPVPLTIVPSKTFTISALPGTADLVRGQQVAFAVKLTSSDGYTSLAALSLSGLPTGITAAFKPSRITAGQTSVLTLTAPASQALGSADLTVRADATVDGFPVSDAAIARLNVIAPTTSFIGRTVVDDALQTPLAGVTVTMLGKNGSGGTTGCTGTTVSDGAGNFALRSLPASCTGPQLVGYDGLTVTSPAGKYAGVNLIYTLSAGQVTTSPVLVHLPRIDDKETFLVRQNHTEDQSYAYKSIPGLSLVVYRGTTITLPDGSVPDPFPLVAVQVPVDRLPDAKPPVPTMLLVFIVAFQPANSVASQPVAVYYPNTLNGAPGQNMPMLTLDPTRGAMVPYGTGTISPDGTQVIPDLIPGGGGKRWGIVNFDWHGPMPQPEPPERDPRPDPCPPTIPCSCPLTVGQPVQISSGIETYQKTDISFGSPRGRITLTRSYRTLSNNNGPFGRGGSHNYAYSLDSLNPTTAPVINLITPDWNRFPFARQTDGTLINTTSPVMLGARMTTFPGGTVAIRWKDGQVFEFTAPGANFPLLSSITDRNGNAVRLVRDTAQPARITQIIDPVGRVLALTYDAANRITSLTDPIGRTVTYTYNAGGSLVSVTDPEGGVTSYEYEAPDRLSREIDRRKITVMENTFDANGRVTQQRQPDGGIWRFAYTLMNPLVGRSAVLQTVVTDPLNRVTTYRFNPEGHLVSTTDDTEKPRIYERSAGTQLVSAVKGTGSCVSCGSAGAGDMLYSHDAAGNLTTETDALGATTEYRYEPNFNQLQATIDPLGNRSETTFDGRGNPISHRDPLGNVTGFTYDSFGQLIETTNALGQKTNYEYDGFGNMVSVADPLGNKTRFRYDALSRLVETIDPLGRRNQTIYDKLDRVTEQIDGRAVSTKYVFDANGNLLTLTDGRGKSTTFTYDSMNRTAVRTDPLGKSDTRTYDLAGNPIRFVDRKGQVSEYKYDQDNRLIEEQYVDALVKRSYDAPGRLVRVEDSQGGVFTMTYDSVGGLLSSAGPTGTLEYTRDALGRVTRRYVIGGATVSHTYDAAGNLKTASMPGASVSYVHDALNRVTGLARANGVDTQHAFDSAGRLLSITHRRGATTLATLSYSYDAAGGRISQQSVSAQPLITMGASATFNDGNHILTRAGSTFTHDANGNLTSETGTGGLTTYSWDGRNRLAALALPSGRTIAFAFNPSGLMLRYTDAATVREYVSDDELNTAEFRVNGGRTSVLGARVIDSHVAVVRSSGSGYFLADAINSTIAIVDSTGTTTNRIAYEPFGQSTLADSTQEEFATFTGRLQITEDLMYYRARFYTPRTARFITEDPMGFVGGTNFFTYVANRPTMSTDPTGQISIHVIGGAILVGAALCASGGFGLCMWRCMGSSNSNIDEQDPNATSRFRSRFGLCTRICSSLPQLCSMIGGVGTQCQNVIEIGIGEGNR
jgi:RHS repeat-associated protein